MNTIHSSNNNNNTKFIFGFWLYIMSDCVLFASLFAMHAVLTTNIMTNLSTIKAQNFSLPLVFIETCCLLLSSVTYSIATIHSEKLHVKQVIFWLSVTALLGICFICLEIHEFHHLIQSGYHPCKNAFFSSFFTLVGTHGVHVGAGLIWIIVMIMHLIYRNNGLTHINQMRLQCLGLFWHFLDIIWICVFTEVYLMRAI